MSGRNGLLQHQLKFHHSSILHAHPPPPSKSFGGTKELPPPSLMGGGYEGEPMKERYKRSNQLAPGSRQLIQCGGGGMRRGGCERARSSLNLAENGHLDLIKRHLTSWIDLSYLAVALSGLTGNVGFASDYALRRPLCLHTGSQSGSVRPIRKLH